jgi:hypothetical protein
MLIKGLIFGFVITLLNLMLLNKFINKLFRFKKASIVFSYVFNAVIRYMIFALLIIAFIKFQIGSILGLFLGIFAAFIFFIIVGRKYVSYS